MGELNVSCDSSKNSTIKANIIHIDFTPRLRMAVWILLK